VAVVALLGLVGGALSGTVAVRNLRGTSTPYAVPVALALLKLPAGALTGIVGLLLVHGEFVPGLTALDSQGQILAYAVVLGVAQQLATRLVDRQAHEVLGRVPSKEQSPGQAEAAMTAPLTVPLAPEPGAPATAASSA
jgi:hypothetical protein